MTTTMRGLATVGRRVIIHSVVGNHDCGKMKERLATLSRIYESVCVGISGMRALHRIASHLVNDSSSELSGVAASWCGIVEFDFGVKF